MKKTFCLRPAVRPAGLRAGLCPEDLRQRYRLQLSAFLPMSMKKTGQPAGFDIDAMNWIAKTMGFKGRPQARGLGRHRAGPCQQADRYDRLRHEHHRETPQDGGLFRSLLGSLPRVPGACRPKLTPADILSKPIKLGVQRGTSEAEAIKQEQKEKGLPLRTALL